MSKGNVSRKQVLEKNRNFKEKEKPSQSFLSKHLKKIYPLGLQKSTSSLSLSSISLLSLSQTSNGSSLTDSSSPLDQKISLALRLIAPPGRSREMPVPKPVQPRDLDSSCGELKRCNWITKNSGLGMWNLLEKKGNMYLQLLDREKVTDILFPTSDKAYVSFHDEQWGVPVYDDNQLFELLALSGMLMDYNWTEILKRQELFREVFAGFDPNVVAKMGEKEISEIASNKATMLAESRVRCIVDNAKCILKIVREFGSFSSYMWGYVNHKPVINRYRYPRNVLLRTPKAEAISRDLLKHGFRFVGPVIVHSFMQAAGLTIDHLIDCFRYSECVSLAERPWRHI